MAHNLCELPAAAQAIAAPVFALPPFFPADLAFPLPRETQEKLPAIPGKSSSMPNLLPLFREEILNPRHFKRVTLQKIKN
jgi:hypothetical protein